jgi:hypothetical protein
MQTARGGKKSSNVSNEGSVYRHFMAKKRFFFTYREHIFALFCNNLRKLKKNYTFYAFQGGLCITRLKSMIRCTYITNQSIL